MTEDAKSMRAPQAHALDTRAMGNANLETGTGISARVITVTLRTIALVGVGCVAFIPLAPELAWGQKWLIMGLVVVIVAISLALVPLARRNPSRAFAALIANVIALIGAVMVIDPKTSVISLIPMLLAVGAVGIVLGRRAGFISAACATASVGLVGALVTSPIGWWQVFLFAAFAVALVLIVDGMTRERRRLTQDLARLYTALTTSSVSTLDLLSNLDAIVESVNEVVGSDWCSIMLLRDGELEIAAPELLRTSGVAMHVRTDRSGALLGGPIHDAVTKREMIVVNDVAAEDRYPIWTEVWGRRFLKWGMPTLVVVPLQTPEKVLGVMTVHAAKTGAFSERDLSLLRTYADQVTVTCILRAQTYEAERESARRLAETDALKSEFLAMVSHELRTPLTAAKGFIDTVLLHWDRLDDDRRKDLLRRSSNNANELTRMISQLLDFARIDADRIDLKPLSCNLRELVDRVTTDIAPVVSERTITVDVDEQVKITTDPDAFNHILVNLITNANKFSPVGSTIRIEAVVGAQDVTVSVTDEGMGIAPDELEKVFERFYQSERTNMTRKGTGIGLAIVKRFVEHQGGRIWAESVLGEGATFKFTVARADLAPSVPPGVSSAAVAAAADLVQPPPSSEAASGESSAAESLPTQS